MDPAEPARIWQETVTIPTYPAPAADPNPMFFENRVNQGASGRIYPNPFTDQVNHDHKIDREYQAVFLENEYIQLMALPRFGGRIHAALDKSNGYDFIYRQHVIKPALIAPLGSWLSGGMEFNWPLHHRPSTFMSVEYTLQEGQDGSVTLWMSEHEPMNRMKGMVGVRVYPGRALFEFKVRLFNRTPLPQPFLWWVNTAVNVNDNYQLIFPPDVESVTFHSRADMAEYPIARQKYAGLDWTAGVDISWPRNVDEATSYFANPSKYDFFGGYDHGSQGGIIHVANRHISPGKKLFTWGQGAFGNGWQESLTDDDGPYVELMASAYSDNQPDFTWIQPYETKHFSQVWYPIQEIGGAKNANSRAALNLEDRFLGICATEELPGARAVLSFRGKTIIDETIDLAPGRPVLLPLEDSSLKSQPGTEVRLLDSERSEIIAYSPPPPKNEPLPETARPPKAPGQIDSLEELYLTGLHVEQYLHVTLDPAPYWERALELDPGDSRSNNALGRLLLRRGAFGRAEAHFRRAIQTLTRYNFNPMEGEPYYNLGLALAYQGRFNEAYEHFYRATWSYAWRAPAYLALAQIDLRRGDYDRAIDHLDRSLDGNAHNNKARVLKAAALRLWGHVESAAEVIQELLNTDPLDHGACAELALLSGDPARLEQVLRGDVQNYLDLAFDYANAGLYHEAGRLLQDLCQGRPPFYGDDSPDAAPSPQESYPIPYYALGYFAAQMGDEAAAADWYRLAAGRPPDYCFPVRLEEQILLEGVREANPSDGRAAYYLGNLYYDKKQYDKAIAAWEATVELEPDFAIPWRNLGIALYNKRGDKAGAKRCYDRALAVDPGDPRLLMEMDQLRQRLGRTPSHRLALLEERSEMVSRRDDLSLTMAELYSQTGRPQKALEILASRRFHAWEGGEGGAAGQYALASVILGQAARDAGDLDLALEHFQAADDMPDNLGIGRGMSLYEVLAWTEAAGILKKDGDAAAAASYYQKVIDLEAIAALWRGRSALTYYAALALRSLGHDTEAESMLEGLAAFAQKKLGAADEAAFHTSKPAMIVFDDDPEQLNRVQGLYLQGLVQLGMGETEEAAASFRQLLQDDPHHWWAGRQLDGISDGGR